MSGPPREPRPADAVVRHARMKRDTSHLWLLQMPTGGGRWEPTPFRDTLDNLVEPLVTQFSWMVAPWDANQGDTSDPEY